MPGEALGCLLDPASECRRFGAERIPWEERGALGPGGAFLRTLVLSVREPLRFYALVPRDASPLPALVYRFVFEIPVALLTFAYAKVVGEPELRETLAGITPALRGVMPRAPELVERALGTSALVTLLLAPVSDLFELVATAGVTWVGLRLTRHLRTSFGTLLRLFAYPRCRQLVLARRRQGLAAD